ncbi:MAG: hypothetical protein HY376_02010 [Candidatus Blackburnbacteria bacterium]|nr:hypothetical protein [Candidatus Blackburnbacteria bacterium]
MQTNKYGASCGACRAYVPPGAGTVQRATSGAWLVQHAVCPLNGPVAQPRVRGEVEDGTYTIQLPGEYRTLNVDTPTKGNFAGRTILSYLAGPDNETDFVGFAFVEGRELRVWRRYADALALREAAQVLLGTSDLTALGEAYAMRSGRCYRCGRKLTVPISLHRGMGPICAAGGRD